MVCEHKGLMLKWFVSVKVTVAFEFKSQYGT